MTIIAQTESLVCIRPQTVGQPPKCYKCNRKVTEGWAPLTLQRVALCRGCIPVWVRELVDALGEAKPQCPRVTPAILIDIDKELLFESEGITPLTWGNRTICLGYPIQGAPIVFGDDLPEGKARWRLVSQRDMATRAAGLDAFIRSYCQLGAYVPPAPPPAPPAPGPEEQRRIELRKLAAAALRDPAALLNLIEEMTKAA